MEARKMLELTKTQVELLDLDGKKAAKKKKKAEKSSDDKIALSAEGMTDEVPD